MKIMFTFATQKKNRQAQMAESVDALVSNTSGVTSIPVRPRVWVLKKKLSFNFFFCIYTSKKCSIFYLLTHICLHLRNKLQKTHL